MFACKAHLQMQTRGSGAGEELTPLSPEVGFRGLGTSRLSLGGSDTPYPPSHAFEVVCVVSFFECVL